MYNQWMLYSSLVLIILKLSAILGADDYNVLNRDGSYEFGYNNPNSFHHSQGNRNNIVRGDFGSRNPATGAIDTIQYTAGPRGFRPRGKNVVRKYDLGQVRTGPIGSKDDPYFDPNEDPSYNFEFKTRTYNRKEAANRNGVVSGKYSYLDDIGERHNVEYIAGKNTGFHVKSPVPDNKPLPFGPLQYVGKRRPVPRGRTTIQRGLDGSYRFVSGGPDHRRTETSDSKGHVRGSYTYLDDKGVRHSVHYIAGPETGYRVLKNVKGPHLPTIFPFARPEIIPPDYYNYPNVDDVFNTAASGSIKPPNKNNNGFADNPNFNNEFGKPGSSDDSTGFESGSPGFSSGKDDDFNDLGGSNLFGSNTGTGTDGFGTRPPGTGASNRPNTIFGNRPGGSKPSKPTYEDDGSDDFGDIFGGSGNSGGSNRPTNTVKPDGGSNSDDGSYKPSGNDGSYEPYGPESTGGSKPIDESGTDGFSNSDRPPTSKPSRPNYEDPGSNDVNDFNLFGNSPEKEPSRPSSGGNNSGGNSGGGDGTQLGVSIGGAGGNNPSGGGDYNEQGTLVTNLGDKLFSVPPGVSVRAHVQAIDLLPLGSRPLSPSQQLKAEESGEIKAESTNIDEELNMDATDDSSTIVVPFSNVTEPLSS